MSLEMIQLMQEVRQTAAELQEELNRYKAYRLYIQQPKNQQVKQNTNKIK